MAKLVWRGRQVAAKVAAASAVGVDRTMADCVEDAAANHPPFPPASEPHERYANRTGFETGAIRIVDGPTGVVGAATVGQRVVGRWGALARYALFLEIGTSISGPTATERADAAGGNMDAIVPPAGPKMAPRPFLRPAADRHYPALPEKIAEAYNS